ncbi:MAG: hypothetical protein MUC63_08990, partial [Planctomycetes bacterium]|nr:hypothetical protein [Planctomycetota bacterium]
MAEAKGPGNGAGWEALLDGAPWFEGEGRFPLPAYSEFMPPPRVGRKPYGDPDRAVFREGDPHGWIVSELEEESELGPGLEHLAKILVGALSRFGSADPEPAIAGQKGRNLQDNPYWPPELASAAGRLPHERFVTLLPLALSRTQDDKARVRWTLFGSSEQGPERAFWKGFFEAPGRERPLEEALAFLGGLLSEAFGVEARGCQDLRRAGFRVLPSTPDAAFPYWTSDPLPSWTGPLLADDSFSFEDVRFLLTFRPFSLLPAAVRARYLAGALHLIPFPGSLVFWGMPAYRALQRELPLAMQVPLLRAVARRRAPGGIQVHQSGWLNEPRRDRKSSELNPKLVAATYRRTNRMNRVARYENDVDAAGAEDRVTRVLFSTESDALGLYDKPLARNCQIWTEDFRLLLDGPRAGKKEIERAAAAVAAGGDFEYRFLYPAMQAGLHEVYWHRPLAAFRAPESGEIRLLRGAPLGYFAAVRAEAPDPAAAVELWPRLRRRPVCLEALKVFDPARDYYALQTGLNVLSIVHAHEALGGKPLPRPFARRLLRLAKDLRLEAWLDSLPGRASDPGAAERVRAEIESRLEPAEAEAAPPLPEALTFGETATRAFEEAFWGEMRDLAHGKFACKDNADPVQDAATLERLPHRHRDLEPLGDLLLARHRAAIREAGMEGQAACGDLPFRWRTDHDFPLFGGWRKNQEGRGSERNLLLVVPGKDRREAVVMADHYDTAYMED